MLTQASVSGTGSRRGGVSSARSFAGAREAAEARIRDLALHGVSSQVKVAPEIEGRFVHNTTGKPAVSVRGEDGREEQTIVALQRSLPWLAGEHTSDKFELVTPDAWEFVPGCYMRIIEYFERQVRQISRAAAQYDVDVRLTQSLRYPTAAVYAQEAVLQGMLPPFVYRRDQRCADIVRLCEEYHNYQPRRICLGEGAGTFDLYSWMLGQKIGVHANSSCSIRDWSKLHRARIAINAILLALSADSPLLCPLGSEEVKATGVMAFRNYDFPGCLFGFGKDNRPRYVESSPGGHPVDGIDGIRHSLLAMMNSERPIFSDPGEDPEAQLHDVMKSSYVWIRQRLEQGHIRDETRSTGSCGSVRTSVAMMALAHAGPYAFIELFGDGGVIPYDFCTANDWQAIERGLDAKIWWPGDSGLVRLPLAAAAKQLIEATKDYHRRLDFSREEIELVSRPLESIVKGTGPLAAKLLAWYEQGAQNWRDLDDVTKAWSDCDIGDWPLDWRTAQRGPTCS